MPRFTPPKPGTVTLAIDNSYSWTRSKTVWYSVRQDAPPEETGAADDADMDAAMDGAVKDVVSHPIEETAAAATAEGVGAGGAGGGAGAGSTTATATTSSAEAETETDATTETD